MSQKTNHLSPYHFHHRGDIVIIENEFVRWEHDVTKGGELCGAYVKHGTNENLLVRPQSTRLCKWVRGGWRQYHSFETACAKAENPSCFYAGEGVVRLQYESAFLDSDGVALEGARMAHTVTYRPSGAAEHELAITIDKDVDLGHVRIGSLAVRDDMNRMAVRPCLQSIWALDLQHPCQWYDLKHAKSRLDLPAYSSRYLPLSVLLVKNGVEGIEMAMGDDLGAWDYLGNDTPGVSQGSVYEEADPWRYEVVFAPLDSPRYGNIVKAGVYHYSYRLTLPYVREKIVPLDIAGFFLRPNDFEHRWPDYKELKAMADDGLKLLRLHDDGDYNGNGIFWRDAAYPPYPPAEMKKMDKSLADAAKAGVKVVPYFSVKEYHPDAAGFERDADSFARRVIPRERFLETFFGSTLFGMEMCLESGWYETRRETIETVLANHPFSGLYFDWCMGLECLNKAHNGGKRHWDNDRLLRLMEWSCNRIGKDGKLYIHLTNTPSLAIENMADVVLTEESAYTDIFPEMFTPHVHFLNIAPRSICMMYPEDESSDQLVRGLALATLLHHATVCIRDSPFGRATRAFYREKKELMASLTEYERHTAPGEGITSTDEEKVGFSLYWKKDGKALGLLANLSGKKAKCNWTVRLNGKVFHGKAEVPALDCITVELDLAKAMAPAK